MQVGEAVIVNQTGLEDVVMAFDATADHLQLKFHKAGTWIPNAGVTPMKDLDHEAVQAEYLRTYG